MSLGDIILQGLKGIVLIPSIVGTFKCSHGVAHPAYIVCDQSTMVAMASSFDGQGPPFPTGGISIQVPFACTACLKPLLAMPRTLLNATFLVATHHVQPLFSNILIAPSCKIMKESLQGGTPPWDPPYGFFSTNTKVKRAWQSGYSLEVLQSLPSLDGTYQQLNAQGTLGPTIGHAQLLISLNLGPTNLSSGSALEKSQANADLVGKVVYNMDTLNSWCANLEARTMSGNYFDPRPPIEILKQWMQTTRGPRRIKTSSVQFLSNNFSLFFFELPDHTFEVINQGIQIIKNMPMLVSIWYCGSDP